MNNVATLPVTQSIPFEPAGWRILLKPVIIEEKTQGGIILPDSVKDVKDLATVVCQVVAMGSEAYSDVDRYGPEGWAKEGDYVMIERFAGAKFKWNNEEYRILNDDEILGITTDPKGISAT